MEPLARGQTRFRIHGPDTDKDDLVSGTYFARKLTTLIRALKEADRQVNGQYAHDYKIASLESSSPTVTLLETPIPKFENNMLARSGIKAFDDCADAVKEGDRDRALRYGRCAENIGKLASGAERSYGYAEVWTGRENVIRVDKFLAEQTDVILHPERVRPAHAGEKWYKGVVEASFDGTIKAVDLRGQLPEIKLILTAGNKQLDCVCRAEDLDVIRTNLDSRVHIYGRAIYDGRSGLPRRVEVRQIEPITGSYDFTKWRGAFQPFEPPDWDLEDT